MSIPLMHKSKRRSLILALVVLFWLAVALWSVNKFKPEFWKDGYSYYLEAKKFVEKGEQDAALVAIEKALGRDPRNAGYLVFEASLHEKVAQSEKAATAYKRALEITPGDPEAILGLARILLSSGNRTEADALLETLPPAATLEPSLLARRAGLRAAYGDQSGAMADFGHLLTGSPDNPAYLRGYAASAMALKNWSAAQQPLTRLLAVSSDPELTKWARAQLVIALRALGRPEDTYALLVATPTPEDLPLRAQLAMELQKFDQAAPLLQEILKGAPENRTARTQLAIALRALHKPAEAYDLLIAIPDAANVRSRAELALELERFAEAAELFRELAQQNPQDIAVREKLAYALDRAAQSQGATAARGASPSWAGEVLPGDAAAESEYKTALASGQADRETRIRYAWLLMRAKRYAEAYAALGDLATADASDDVLELAANAAFLAGKFEQAIVLLTVLTGRQAQNAAWWRNLADAYDARKEPASASKAMERYLQLAPDDQEARIKLAGMFARSGDTSRAEVIYRDALGKNPKDITAITELTALYASQKRFSAAIAVLAKGVALLGETHPGLLYRLGQLYEYNKEYGAAIRTYGRLLGTPGVPPAMRRTASLALAELYLTTGNAPAARSVLQNLHAWDSHDPQLLLLAARASMLGNDPAKAVSALEKLSSVRVLKPEEQEWLAGQYRLIGQKAKALALYEQLMATGRLLSAQGLAALGDLQFDAGKYGPALAAYERSQNVQPATARALKIARAADKVGNKPLAQSSYEQFLASNPTDPALLLEIARFGIKSGQYSRALSLYDRVVASRGSKGLLLELALANLAAKRFEHAEKWARQAVETGEGGFKAVLALVQALHLEGKTFEADRLLGEHKKEVMASPDGREWLGYVGVARDRQLQAYEIFNELAQQEGTDQGKMWLWRGIAATRRGDFRRARESFEKAKQYGAQVPTGAVAP